MHFVSSPAFVGSSNILSNHSEKNYHSDRAPSIHPIWVRGFTLFGSLYVQIKHLEYHMGMSNTFCLRRFYTLGELKMILHSRVAHMSLPRLTVVLHNYLHTGHKLFNGNILNVHVVALILETKKVHCQCWRVIVTSINYFMYNLFKRLVLCCTMKIELSCQDQTSQLHFGTVNTYLKECCGRSVL